MILRVGALDKLNEEARDALLIMINTGARPSEIIDADMADYRLTENIPISVDLRKWADFETGPYCPRYPLDRGVLGCRAAGCGARWLCAVSWESRYLVGLGQRPYAKQRFDATRRVLAP